MIGSPRLVTRRLRRRLEVFVYSSYCNEMQLPIPNGRSMFTTAAALASAYYAVALGRNAACDSARSPASSTPPSAQQGSSGSRFGLGRSRSHSTSSRGNEISRGTTAASYSTVPPQSAPPVVDTSRVLTTSVVAFKGQRSYMEDDFFVSKDGSFVGVFDGHGGAAVSKYLRQNLHAQFLTNLPDEDRSKVDDGIVMKALADAFKAVDDAVVRVKHWSYMGSTAVVVVVQWNEQTKQASLVSANVGDSRAVLSRKGKAIDLTVDHKPNMPAELERVKKLGGTVRWYGLVEQDGRPMEGMGVYRINGNLAVARAIGDRSERPFVSGEVDLKQFKLEEGDQFIILASDGLWDVMTSEEAVHFVQNTLSGHVGALREGEGEEESDRPVEVNISDWTEQYADDRGIIRAAMMARKKKMARYLSEEAFRRGTMDNVTVIVVWLK